MENENRKRDEDDQEGQAQDGKRNSAAIVNRLIDLHHKHLLKVNNGFLYVSYKLLKIMGLKLLEKWKALFKAQALALLIFSALASLSPATAGAVEQGRTVSGKVTDENGEAIPGVNIVIKGSTTGTITDMDGNYSINVNDGDILVFSYIGYTAEEIPVNNQLALNVSLVPDLQELQEVVVIGYGETSKVTLTGAIKSISNEELVQSPSAGIGNALAGKVTGISSVQFSGQPGADDAKLFIRGVATLNDATPLTIVDGVERPFTQIDPEEVESISILKDASATAVYGVRGANGVIIVTTRRGREGKARITVNSSYGLQEPTRILEQADSYIYALGHNERALNDGADSASLVFDQEMIDAYKSGGNLIYPNTNWREMLMKDLAPQMKHNITISGGTKKVKYFTSFGYFSQNGQFKNFDREYNGNFKYDRFNYRTNLDVDVTSSTKMKVTVGGRTEMRNRPRESDDSGLWKDMNWAQPMSGSGIVDGKWIVTSQDYTPLELRDGMRGFYGRGYANSTADVLNFDLDLIQDLDMLTKGLKFKVKGSYNTSFIHYKNRSSSAAKYEAKYLTGANGELVLDENGEKQIILVKVADEGNLGYDESTGKNKDWYMEAALNYDRKFGPHQVGGLFLYNQRVNYYPGGSYNYIPNATLGFVGRVNYNYKSRYIFDVNMGYNGSENFPQDKRFGFFPAASAGWVVSEENFMKGLSFLNYFKFRGSYGIVGNDKFGGERFLYRPDTWDATAPGYNFGLDNPADVRGAVGNLLGNPNVTWERAIKQNYGFNALLFDELIEIDFDVFHEKREDILIRRQTIPSYVAADLPVVNMGEVENKGFEAEVTLRQNVSDFSYYVKGNVSFARNKVLYKDEVPHQWDYLYETGQPVGQPFGYIYDGFFDETMETNPEVWHPDQGPVFPGDVRYLDLNNDSLINDFDKKPIGYTENPEYIFGLNAGFNYKNFDLSSTWTAATHTSRLLVAYYREPFGGQNRGLFKYMYDGRWTPDAENPVYPRFSVNSGSNNYKDSDLWLKDASYIRLKNVELGYTFRSEGLKSIGLNSARLYVNGYNLLTFSKLKMIDPEEKPNSGGNYPLIRIYNMGLKLNF